MNICEIFFSLQGESTFAGLPCIFIRTSGCNLRCNYCDTTYSFASGREFTIDEIMQEISPYACNLVEITGGEPLLQPDVIELMQKLDTAGYTILLETNGSLPLLNLLHSVHIITDVKLPGSGSGGSFLPNNLARLKPGHDEIKFVVADREDFDIAIAFIMDNQLLRHTLLFSPVSDKLEPAILAEWIKQSGLPLRLNLQLHKLLNFR